MIVLHAIWVRQRLHLWGEAVSVVACEGNSYEPNAGAPSFDAFAVPVDELRQIVGEVWNTLLASDLSESAFELRVPFVSGRPLGSILERNQPSVGANEPVTFETLAIPSLCIDASDALDVLTSWPAFERRDIRRGDSYRFWSRTAELALEWLARQRFVPDVRESAGEGVRGLWRVIASDGETVRRIELLASAIPPVCRAGATDPSPSPAHLVEEFLWVTVDAFVRRCLEQDELALSLLERSDADCTPEIRWLRSLVGADAKLHSTSSEAQVIQGKVHEWIGRVEPSAVDREFDTCFKLHAPDDLSERGADEPVWKLSLALRSTRNQRTIIESADLSDDGVFDSVIFRRSIHQTWEQLRQDVSVAARHFPPLAPCALPGGPLDIDLNLNEAYSFLRDASPVLEAEGFGVFVPRWWRDRKPRMRMRLNLRPPTSPGADGAPTMRLDAIVEYDWRLSIGDEELSEDELRQLAIAKEPLVKLRGQWTELQRSEIDTAMEFIRKNGGGQTTVMDALRSYFSADDVDTGVPVSDIRSSGWVQQLLNAQDHNEQLDVMGPPVGFVGELRPYQIKGLSWLMFLSKLGLGACLADDMGLGKTIQLIAAMLSEREGGKSPGPTLLIVPMSVVGNWQREIARFGPSLRSLVHHGTERMTGPDFAMQVEPYDVVISTYGLAHRDREALGRVPWYRVALDEAQNIKNSVAKQAAAVRSFQTSRRVALTGTPVENRLSELWSILDFLNPNYLGTAAEFRRRFAVPIERYHDVDRSERLRQLIRPFVLRRLKNDPNVQVDLPPKFESKVLCNLTREQASLYQAIVDEMIGQIDRSGGIQRRGLILAALTKLKQVCNHPSHFLGEEGPIPGRSGKCDRAMGMLDEVVSEGHRALVFTHFREMGLLLQNALQEMLHREVLFLHGGSTQKQRESMIARFQSATDAPVFILSLRAGGVGLNLTAANHVFHFDRWWNPAVEDQATDRAYRIGQDKQVQVHKFVCIGTLEERIDQMIDHKKSLAENIVGSGEDWLTELSTDALRDLFALSRDAVAED